MKKLLKKLIGLVKGSSGRVTMEVIGKILADKLTNSTGGIILENNQSSMDFDNHTAEMHNNLIQVNQQFSDAVPKILAEMRNEIINDEVEARLLKEKVNLINDMEDAKDIIAQMQVKIDEANEYNRTFYQSLELLLPKIQRFLQVFIKIIIS